MNNQDMAVFNQMFANLPTRPRQGKMSTQTFTTENKNGSTKEKETSRKEEKTYTNI